MVSALRAPSTAIPLESFEVSIMFPDETLCSYPKSVIDSLGIPETIESLKTKPETFELLLNLRKKCLHEVCGEWAFENPRLVEELENLIFQLYGEKTDHPFTFIREELSALTLAQSDMILRSYTQNNKMQERKENDSVVRYLEEVTTPYLVVVARETISRKNLGTELYIKFAAVKHESIRAQRSLERKRIKLIKTSSQAQKLRLEEAVTRLVRRIENLEKNLHKLSDSGYPDLHLGDKDSRLLPIAIRFGETQIMYPPRLRKYLYECQFYRNDKPVSSVLILEKKEYFDIFIKLIEGVPLRKQLGSHLCDDMWLFEKLSNCSRHFTVNVYAQLREELRYLTFDEAMSIYKKEHGKCYLKEVSNEILNLANYFSSTNEAANFFLERADLFDEVQRLRRKQEKEKTDFNQTQYEKAKEKLELIDSRLKFLPISIEGQHNLAQNDILNMAEPLGKIEAYKKHILSLLSIPEHLKPFIKLFDYYGFVVRKIEGEVVVSFCGYQDYEFDFEDVSGYEFESTLRKQIELVFPAAGNPTYESKFNPQTKEDLIRCNPKLYMNRPRVIRENLISVPLASNVLTSREAFKTGKPNREDTKVLIIVNNWERFGIKPEDIIFEKTVNEETKEPVLKCSIREGRFIINPITLRANLRGHNMIRTNRILEEKWKTFKKTDI